MKSSEIVAAPAFPGQGNIIVLCCVIPGCKQSFYSPTQLISVLYKQQVPHAQSEEA